MNNSEIKLFFSWQSDLPGGDTRNIIQDSIKEVVKLLRDTVEVDADRDTQGEFGAPDIAQTIFNKIDECDIFIADVTAVCEYEIVGKDEDYTGKKKLFPNPNVMLELGYAAHVVGWENIICILNTDYGAIENMPFDIASRRLTPYSIKSASSKGEVRRFLRSVIQDTVENLMINGKKVKGGFSNIIVGSYDFEQQQLISDIIPWNIKKSGKYCDNKRILLDSCKNCVEDIMQIALPKVHNIINSSEKEEKKMESNIVTKDGTILKPAHIVKLFDLRKVEISKNDRTSIIELVRKYLEIDIGDLEDFFDVGNLKKRNRIGVSCKYEGTNDEQRKYELIKKLEGLLLEIDLWEQYIETYDELYIIPLAIENRSSVFDEDTNVYLKVDLETADIIVPDKNIITDKLKGIEGIIYEKDIIKKLIMMPENAEIQYDVDISYNVYEAKEELCYEILAGGINGNPRYDSDDYGRELSKYIASPMENSSSEYEFYIKSLRPNEKKWLGPAIILKPKTDGIEISYKIMSNKSSGALKGVIKIKTDVGKWENSKFPRARRCKV